MRHCYFWKNSWWDDVSVSVYMCILPSSLPCLTRGSRSDELKVKIVKVMFDTLNLVQRIGDIENKE